MPVELAAELLSGPDLGGGFLCQLTRDRAPLPEGFTIHLQEAGTDGGEPPAGSPELVGFTHPTVACMYGGAGCWHRHFSLPRSELMKVRFAYNRTRFVLRPLLDQAAGNRPAPFAETLSDLLDRLSDPLRALGVRWWLVGAGALRLRGALLEPRELALVVEEPAVDPIGALFSDYLIEPAHPEPRPGGGEVRIGAAFLGTLAAGMRVAWRAAVGSTGDSELDRELLDGSPDAPVRWKDRSVPTGPNEAELLRAALAEPADRWTALLERASALSIDPSRLDRLLAGPEIPSDLRASVRRFLGRSTGSTTASSA